MFYTSESLNKNYLQIQSKKYFVHICIMHQKTSFLRAEYYAQRQLCIKTLKWNELKVYISLKGNKLQFLQIAKGEGSFQVHDLVPDIWKKY